MIIAITPFYIDKEGIRLTYSKDPFLNLSPLSNLSNPATCFSWSPSLFFKPRTAGDAVPFYLWVRPYCTRYGRSLLDQGLPRLLGTILLKLTSIEKRIFQRNFRWCVRTWGAWICRHLAIFRIWNHLDKNPKFAVFDWIMQNLSRVLGPTIEIQIQLLGLSRKGKNNIDFEQNIMVKPKGLKGSNPLETHLTFCRFMVVSILQLLTLLSKNYHYCYCWFYLVHLLGTCV